MGTKVLIVDPDIGFAVGIKRALEQAGNYNVTVFANGQAAIELLRTDPQDVAIIDFALTDIDIGSLINTLRAAQPDLFLLVSPRTREHVVRLPQLDIQGSITKPYLARQLIPVMRESVAARARLAKKVKAAPSAPPPPLSVPLSPDFDAAIQVLGTMPPEPPISPDDTFRRQIAAMLPDKPATPNGLRKTLETVMLTSDMPVSESATIADLVSGKPLSDPVGSPQPESLPEASVDAPPRVPDATSGIAAAALDALDTVPIDQFTLQAYLAKVEQQSGQRMSDVTPGTPPVGEPSHDPEVAALAQPNEAPDDESAADAQIPSTSEAPAADLPSGEAATIALRLTQLSLQLAARETILTRDDTAVAVAGDLSTRAVAGVIEAIVQAWQGTEDDNSALIRYIQVPGIGDFLLYSTQSVNNMRLSMLFPAETSLRIIRQQAHQLIDALEKTSSAPAESQAEKTLISRPTDLRPPEGLSAVAVLPIPDQTSVQTDQAQPHTASAIVPVTPRADGPYSAYTFVWLPRGAQLNPAAAALMLGWLDEAAAAHAWQIEGVEVQPAYITLQISIPANETPSAVVELLMKTTAERAAQSDLWADAYYVVAPGRSVTQQEVTQFMNYSRTFEQPL